MLARGLNKENRGLLMGDLCTMIPWVLERIVNQEYFVTRDSNGQIEGVELHPR